MAIAKTGALYRSFSFNGTSSRKFGVYITGQGVYNAPERAVEMVEIPGRNGDFALDQGRFSNIEVTYPASIAANNDADFREAISELRSLLCADPGYCRLEDEYNPDEYRMAMYKSGLDVDPVSPNAGEFELVFECKPQRFLKSGETAETVASGSSLTNPTPYTSQPLLEVYGHGTINLGNHTITLLDEILGNIDITKPVKSRETTLTLDYSRLTTFLNQGDAITIPSNGIRFGFTVHSDSFPNIWFEEASTLGNCEAVIAQDKEYLDAVMKNKAAQTLTAFPASTETKTLTDTLQIDTDGTGGLNSNYISLSITITNSPGGVITVSFTWNIVQQAPAISMSDVSCNIDAFSAYSTASGLGTPTYIDCEIGEAYKYDHNDNIASLNKNVVLGAKLPELTPGTTSVTFDNTITQLGIAPRWWKV